MKSYQQPKLIMMFFQWFNYRKITTNNALQYYPQTLSYNLNLHLRFIFIIET